ncbi:unnamed protein product [Clonostachys byssicola]|uniref:N-acetyltransferase domain-containing protein n=1 Tax=Clonostachys byssicola TaxID=160290 RepID=A0A9N9UKW9_9HYPO|nr:unnamed protein product [Clonostachys byssicola]
MGNRGHLSATARIRAYATIRRRRILFPVKSCLVRCKPTSHSSSFGTWRKGPAEAKRWSTIKTTLPRLPPHSERKTTTTGRLTLRPLQNDSHDLAALHALRTDEKVMRWSPRGRVDANLKETYVHDLEFLADPSLNSEHLAYAICLKSNGEFIGYGGLSCRPEFVGWPAVSFVIKSDLWGQGYATEFLEGFVDMWRRLPRKLAVIRVLVNTVYGDSEIKDECLAGNPTYDNVACHRVLEKSGFEKREEFDEYNHRRKKKERRHGWVMKKSNAHFLEEQLSALQITGCN